MSKEIILETEIEFHPKVQLIKVYRTANAKIGKLKHISPTTPKIQFQICMNISILQAIQKKAGQLGFQIWVNENGKTGHTHDKDYRESEEELHDYDEHTLRIALHNSERNVNG